MEANQKCAVRNHYRAKEMNSLTKPLPNGASDRSLDCECLRQYLDSIGVSPDVYCLSGGLPNESYVLSQEGERKWAVYYSEKGIRTSLSEFGCEHDACTGLLEMMKRDHIIGPRIKSQPPTL